jgi:hypothetical protein
MKIADLLSSAARTTVGAALGLGLAWSVLGPNTARAEPAMWVVKDADSTVYLFGTVHLLKKDVVWNTPKVQAAMASPKSSGWSCWTPTTRPSWRRWSSGWASTCSARCPRS